MDGQYTRASFWKCALQVNPFGYIKYRGQGHGLTEDQYNRELLRIAKENNVKVVGLADHGNVDSVDQIRDLMNTNGIVVFPGFEISTTEKVHFVCLFPENTTKDQLNRYLGALGLTNAEDDVWPSNLGGNDVLSKVNELGGFVYAAHCNESSGILNKKLTHVWQNTMLKAAQISGSLDDLRNDGGSGYYQIILNKTPEYKREKPIGIINAKDVAVPDDLANPLASCLIKMTRPCFDSFKLAFQDPDSRIRLNSDISKKYYSCIEDLKIISGYLDGLNIKFSEHLNAVIGGRGTGKSTLLECIRYALGLEPIGKSARKQHEEIIKENLGKLKARVELTICSSSMNGKKFTIARRYGESVVVKDEAGVISSFTSRDLLPGVELYGQNEIYEIAQDSSGQRNLLNRFLDSDEQNNDSKIDEIISKLKDNRKQIIEAQGNVSNIEDEVAKLPKLQEQLAQYKNLGLEEKLDIVPKLEIEKNLRQNAIDGFNNLEKAFLAIYDNLPDVAVVSDASIEPLPHAKILRGIRTTFEKVNKETNAILAQLKNVIDSNKTSLESICCSLLESINSAEGELEKSFKELPSCEGRSGKEIGILFQNLIKEIERIRPKELLLISRKTAMTELYKSRKSLLDELSSIRAARTSNYERSIKKLNKKLDGKLKLTVIPEADRTPLIKLLLSYNLDGVAEGRLSWIKLAEDFSPVKLSELIAGGAADLKNSRWGVTPTVADALTRLSVAQCLEIAEVELPDQIKIELNVAHDDAETYRAIEKLSRGQQCTAILHLLLLNNLDPLIIDQPEDNLDNAFIADRIVAELRSAKVARQFIFATHNANIPVFGDAEWIGVLTSSEERAEMPAEFQGAIDLKEIGTRAAEILEGGKAAFIQRKDKYGF